MIKKIRVGTRGSLLARTQTGMVLDQLKLANPDVEFELTIVKTTGDVDQKTSLAAFGFQGVFIKELEDALYRNEIDLAVHSLKDVPHQLPSPMKIASYIKREDPRDVLISQGDLTLEELPEGAKVGTGSPRRMLQLKAIRDDLNFCELRGNIDTRLSKVQDGEYDAIILAAAGLHRISYQDKISHYLESDQMIPAIAQGIIAIETRADDEDSQKVALSVEDSNARIEAEFERQWMKRLGGGCKAPMAAKAKVIGSEIQFEAILGTSQLDRSIQLETVVNLEEWAQQLEILAADFENRAKAEGIPLPSELPEHALLNDQPFNGQKK